MSKKKGLIGRILCCFGDDDSVEEPVVHRINELRPALLRVNRQTPTPKKEDKTKLHQVEKVTGTYQIESTFLNENLITNTAYSKETPYNCPICLLYFNNVLVASCCQNQICRGCLEGIVEAEIKSDRNPKCQFCQSDKQIHYSDIKETDKVIV